MYLLTETQSKIAFLGALKNLASIFFFIDIEDDQSSLFGGFADT